MNAVKNDVEQLVKKELAAADEKFPQFHSAHEGYAVILEEVEEFESEFNWGNIMMEAIWRKIKSNDNCKSNINSLKIHAINAACEAIQVAAMCDKFMRLENKEAKQED